MTDVDAAMLKEVMRSLAQRKRTITPALIEANKQRSLLRWRRAKGKVRNAPKTAQE